MRYFIDCDDDGRWYLVPADAEESWVAWRIHYEAVSRATMLAGTPGSVEHDLDKVLPFGVERIDGPDAVSFEKPDRRVSRT